jgi:carboxylesterase
MQPLRLIPGAEPFFFAGGEGGCLLVHGFTATPNEVRPLGRYLAGRGYTVLGPRLAHHGVDAADMNRSRWHDWYLSALDGWHLLQDQCRQIAVVGISMGGATALLLAARQPVAAVVAMSTPIHLPLTPLYLFARAVAALRPLWPKQAWDESQRASRYDQLPVRAVAELRAYLKVVERALPAVTAPALLIHSRADATVPPHNLARIYRRLWSVQHKEKWLLQEGQHVATFIEASTRQE